MLKVGVIGTGVMGRHHVRVFSSLSDVDLVGFYDSSGETAESISDEFGVKSYSDIETLLGEVEAAVLATPTESHCELGCRILERDIDLLIEKPIAGTLEEADRLVAAAEGNVLAVGHIEFHNPGVEFLLSMDPKPGFIEVQRMGTFSPRSLDVDVVLDLMIHDLQILHALDPSPVAEIRATGINVLTPLVDIVNCRLALESGCVASLTASRVSAEKIRKLRVLQPSRYFSLDYQSQEIKAYRLERSGSESKIIHDDVQIEHDEPLRREALAFVEACQGRPARIVSAAEARRALTTALSIAEAVQQPG